MPRPSLSRLPAGIAVAVPAALLLGAPPASAHPMPHSVVLLDVHDTSVTADLELPVTDFATASGLPVTAGPLPTDAIRSYLIAHIKPSTDGRAWTVTVGDVSLSQAEQTTTEQTTTEQTTTEQTTTEQTTTEQTTAEQTTTEQTTTGQTTTGPYRELLASATLTPPPGVPVRRFTLGYDVIVHRVVTHTALVSVRHDWSSGRTGAATLGTIGIDIRSMTVPPLAVDLGRASAWRGFAAMLRLGGEHILTGTDHLLFLLILLLPAPLSAVGRRWRSTAPTRVAIARIGRTTVAFTIGHSIALAVSALGRVHVPAWPVEALIAASILIGAIHAIRPLFPGREGSVAGVFGLAHGMAFSFTLAEMRLNTGQLALSLLGFNLGIELVQLLLVALALPTILAVAHLEAPLTRRISGTTSRVVGGRGDPRVCDAVRMAGATATAIAATGWLVDRLGVANPIARAADSAGAHPTPMLVALAAAALLALARSVLRRRSRRGSPPARTGRGPGRRPWRPSARA
ncbi:HupE/UreJ family protein [Actinoplanes sp. KI2]|uniref:HupE/UreJ family protein n=1 Tax=Actinoplanes sp. KI2 TaxID=2983315 RepID=UPI0021D5B165|nr:HupE/UreJ family protein [Actinoplanes sp. KI2]MCU7729276.1 HupE/UreJ family protein [Actinoplanes sp. KI2]